MSELTGLVAHLFDSLQQLWEILGIAMDRFITNMSASFTMMDTKKWIRLVMIVGTYLLVRPYFLKWAGKRQEQGMEKAEGDEGKISANELRGQVDIPEDSDDEGAPEGDGATTASDWGKKARKRQRNMLRKMIDAEEKRLQDLQDDEEDKDIEQYLT